MTSDDRFKQHAIYLQQLITAVLHPCGLTGDEFVREQYNHEYGAHTFLLESQRVHYRLAKTTPTKQGQFVTLWTRDDSGLTRPYHVDDSIDLCIITCHEPDHLGYFIIPSSILAEQGILSTNNREGKRGFRVYPLWVKTDNRQATKTQEWQLNFFLPLTSGHLSDVQKAKQLFAFK